MAWVTRPDPFHEGQYITYKEPDTELTGCWGWAAFIVLGGISLFMMFVVCSGLASL